MYRIVSLVTESYHWVVINSSLAGKEEGLQPIRMPAKSLQFAGLYPAHRRGQSILIIDRYHSLPRTSRSFDEILEDRATEVAFQASSNRSITRRDVPRYESEFVVEFLDNLSDRYLSIGRNATQHIYNLQRSKPVHEIIEPVWPNEK